MVNLNQRSIDRRLLRVDHWIVRRVDPIRAGGEEADSGAGSRPVDSLADGIDFHDLAARVAEDDDGLLGRPDSALVSLIDIVGGNRGRKTVGYQRECRV